MNSRVRSLVSIVVFTLVAFAPALRAQTMPTVSILYGFTGGADGRNPTAGLIQGSDGNFYGTADYGGLNGVPNGQTIFRLTPAGALTTLHTFTEAGSNEAFPAANLAVGRDGNFYGVTEYGGNSNDLGTVFKITPAGVLTTLHTFTGLNSDGANPYAGLLLGADGNFYGTTITGGASNDGTVFRMTPAGALTTLHSFARSSTDGANPRGKLAEDSAGNFYGTTTIGGSSDGNGAGTVFQITPAGVTTLLHAFTDTGTDGNFLVAGMVKGRDGNFYGTTEYGGGSGAMGTVFRITPTGGFTTLHRFTEGAYLRAALVLGSDGNFYGTTANSDSGGGIVFRMTPSGVTTVLHSFTGGADGIDPESDLFQGSDGNFYGTSVYGGSSSGQGTVFKVNVVPAITSAASATATVGKAFSYRITASNSPTSFSVTGLPGGLTVNAGTGLISGTPKATGKVSLILKATNSFGSGTKILALTISAPTPVITSATTASATVGRAFSYQIAATNSPTRYGESGLPAGLTINQTTGKISGTPKAAGTSSVTIAAFNAAGSGSAKLTLTVKAAAPVITSAPTANATVGTAFSYQITATNSPASYGESGLPGGLTINQTTGKISGTPTKAGTYVVTIAAFNSGGSGSAKLTLTVKAAAAKPVITSSLNPPSRQGVAFSYQITATNNPTSYGESGIPSGLTINQATGKITGIPTKAGTYKVTIAASNSGGKGTATLTLTVKPPA